MPAAVSNEIPLLPESGSAQHTDGRVSALDGLRGVAALIVVVYHFMSAFTPSVVPMQSASVPGWVDSPLGIFFNGTFSVHVFFVLSGFVLSNSSFRPRERIVLDCFLRYLRLALPATASVLIAWALLKTFPHSASQLGDVTPGKWLGWTHQGDIPAFGSVLRDGFIDVFRYGGSQFNNVLWTMRTELIGSFGIYFFFQFVTRYRFTILLLIGAALSTSSVLRPYVAFVFGALLCIAARRAPQTSELACMMLFATGVVIGSQSEGFADRTGLNGLPGSLEPGNQHAIFYPVAAAAIVAAVIGSSRLRALFSGRVPVFLGQISFPLYLLHVPLIYTIFAAWSLSADSTAGIELLLVVALPFLVVSIASAWIFEKKIDQPLLALLKRLKTA
jgi:peptidoglycan/LPS O-acetylase OafA/YrhL